MEKLIEFKNQVIDNLKTKKEELETLPAPDLKDRDLLYHQIKNWLEEQIEVQKQEMELMEEVQKEITNSPLLKNLFRLIADIHRVLEKMPNQSMGRYSKLNSKELMGRAKNILKFKGSPQ
jgi:hypothetical protein